MKGDEYQPNPCGVDMFVFDQLPPELRNQINRMDEGIEVARIIREAIAARMTFEQLAAALAAEEQRHLKRFRLAREQGFPKGWQKWPINRGGTSV